MNTNIHASIKARAADAPTGLGTGFFRSSNCISGPGRRHKYWIGIYVCFLGVAALADSPAEVRQQLSEGKTITLIDVRPTGEFKNGHVLNAINIPAALIVKKQLPPLGFVVVYDEGLGRDLASSAAAALNQKSGITAKVMDGGLAAWKMTQSATTQPAGMRAEALPMITYHELKKKSTNEVVLVDLRQPQSLPSGNTASKSAIPLLTSLQAEFPGIPIVQSLSSAAVGRQTQSSRGTTPPLLVLIDNGNGKADETARSLKAGGNTRFVILAGGESILVRKGAAGLQRAGATLTVRPSPTAVTGPPKP